MKKVIFIACMALAASAEAQTKVNVIQLAAFRPSGKDTVILIEDKETVTIFTRFDNDGWNAEYKGQTGTIKDIYLDFNNSEYKALRSKYFKDKNLNEVKYELIQKHGFDLGNGMYYRRVSLGMSTYMVSEILGRPESIRTIKTTYGTSEYWTYPKGLFKFTIIHFDDGKITAMSDDQ